MNKFLIAFERWCETLAQARVNAALTGLEPDPWSLHIVPARRYAKPDLQRPGGGRTISVHPDCTTAGQSPDEIESRRNAA